MGHLEGETEGGNVGILEGTNDGLVVGVVVGIGDGIIVGMAVGTLVEGNFEDGRAETGYLVGSVVTEFANCRRSLKKSKHNVSIVEIFV